MGLMLVADSLDDLPEGLRAKAAKAGDGKVTAAIADGWAVEQVEGLRKALREERHRASEAEKQLRAFEGIDDPEQARDALDRLKAGTLKSSKDLDAYRSDLQAKVAKDLEAVRQEKAALEAQLTETLVDRDAATAIARNRGKPALLLPLLKARVRVEQNGDGRRQVVVMGDDGKAAMSQKSGSVAPMGIEEFVEGLRAQADYASAFEAVTGAGGSGAAHNAGGSARSGLDLTKLSGRELLARANNEPSAAL